MKTSGAMFPIPLLFVYLVLVCSTGCIPSLANLDPDGRFSSNYIFVHPDGYAIGKDDQPLRTQDLEEYLDKTIFKGIDRFAKELTRQPGPLNRCAGGPLRLMIFVHGGLNGYDDSFRRMRSMLEKISPDDPTDTRVLLNTCYYPIFLNWNSDLPDSLNDDLFRIRWGRPDKIVSFLTFPFVLFGRLIGSAANMPASLMHNGYNISEAWVGAKEEGDPGIQRAFGTAQDVAFLGFHVVTAPLLEGFGRPAWDIMKRRAQLAATDRLTDEPGTQNAITKQAFKYLFGTPSVVLGPPRRSSPCERIAQQEEKSLQREKDPSSSGPADKQSTRTEATHTDEGAARTFVKRLGAWMRYEEEKWKWCDGQVSVEITLVGHSMGSLVINRLLNLFEGTEPKNRYPVRHLVYMAPAASTDENDQFVRPYLERVTSSIPLSNIKFSTFLLNRRDETQKDDWWLFFMPRGSLLVWIDTFFESETTWGQATSGRVLNLSNSYGLCSPTESGPFCPPTGSFPTSAPLKKQFRIRNIKYSIPEIGLARRNVMTIRDSPRSVGTNNVPSSHGDFTEPNYFGEVLCTVDPAAFQDLTYCDRPPDWVR